jgi:hypothetical protein
MSCALLAGCGADVFVVTTSPSVNIHLIAGQYAVSFVSPLPAGCPLQRLEIVYRNAWPLAQQGDRITYTAENVPFSSLRLTGRVEGQRLVYTLSYTLTLTALQSLETVDGGGTAIIREDRIAGPFDGNISLSHRASTFDWVTTSCRATNVPFILIRGSIP